MKKIFFVVFLIQIFSPAHAESLLAAIDNIEKEWAAIYYKDTLNPSEKYAQLFAKANTLAKNHPDKAEPLLWQAIITASDADHQGPLKAIEQITLARDLLNKAIEIAPKGLNGSAHVVLGTLYYLTPPWPIAFGDNEKAEELLTQALKIAPNSIDANYFYGDYLLQQNNHEQAEIYFKNAIKSPSRKNQLFADESLKNQAKLALENATDRKLSHAKEHFVSFSSSSATP